MANPNPNKKGLMPGVETGRKRQPCGHKLISDRYAYIAEEKLPENIHFAVADYTPQLSFADMRLGRTDL